MKRCLAAVTMVYNEEDFLPIWLRYYGRQVGHDNCYVLDHGSTDGSTTRVPGANVLRMPRTPLDESHRSRFVADFCASLLSWYDFVLHTDADEIIVADPARYEDLPAFCRNNKAEVSTTFGLNVIHRLGREPPLMPDVLIGRQRLWAMPFASMCKPALISRPVRWTPGFHTADTPIEFSDLFLMHLAFADLDIALRRQRRRQAQPRVNPEENPHHQIDCAEIAEWLGSWAMLDEVYGTLAADCATRQAFVDRVLKTQDGREHGQYRIDITLTESRLWRLPERFAGAF